MSKSLRDFLTGIQIYSILEAESKDPTVVPPSPVFKENTDYLCVLIYRDPTTGTKIFSQGDGITALNAYNEAKDLLSKRMPKNPRIKFL